MTRRHTEDRYCRKCGKETRHDVFTKEYSRDFMDVVLGYPAHPTEIIVKCQHCLTESKL